MFILYWELKRVIYCVKDWECEYVRDNVSMIEYAYSIMNKNKNNRFFIIRKRKWLVLTLVIEISLIWGHILVLQEEYYHLALRIIGLSYYMKSYELNKTLDLCNCETLKRVWKYWCFKGFDEKLKVFESVNQDSIDL